MVVDSLKKLDRDKVIKGLKEDTVKFASIPNAVKLWMNAWPSQHSNVDIIRASGAYFLCPREFVLNYWQPQPNRSFDWNAYLKMNTGTFLHEYIQNCILGPMGVLYGKWHKFAENGIEIEETTEGFHPDPERAVHEIVTQKPLTYRYHEYNVWNTKYRMSGHLDGKLDIRRVNLLHKSLPLLKTNPEELCNRLHSTGSGDRFNLEIKTVSDYQFRKLETEKDIADYYKAQACVYQKLSGIHKTVFWYIERNEMKSKVFVYDFEDGWWRDIQRKATIVWRSIRDETLPESMMACRLPTDKRAQGCAFKQPCWRNIDFKKYVEDGKVRAEKENRKLLDLSKWEE